MQTELAIPQVMNDQCTALGIPVTGNSVGKMSLTDFAGAVRGPYPQILGWRPKGIGALAGCILTALLGKCSSLILLPSLHEIGDVYFAHSTDPR